MHVGESRRRVAQATREDVAGLLALVDRSQQALSIQVSKATNPFRKAEIVACRPLRSFSTTRRQGLRLGRLGLQEVLPLLPDAALLRDVAPALREAADAAMRSSRNSGLELQRHLEAIQDLKQQLAEVNQT